MSKDDLPNVRPIEWVQAVRKYLLGMAGPEHEQLVLDGMPEPPDGVTYRAFLGWVWTWASSSTGSDIRASNSTYAKLLDVHPRTVMRSAARAVKDGWLVKVSGSNNWRPNEYHLAIPHWFVGDMRDTYESESDPVDNQVVGDMRGTYEGDGSDSYVTRDAFVGDMKSFVGDMEAVRRRHERHTTSRPVDQNNNQGNFQRVDNQGVDDFFAELLLFINDEAKPTLTKTLRGQLEECIQRGHTAVSIRDEWLVDLPKNYGPGIICQQIKRASQNYPKHLATSPVTTNFIREVVEGKEMPA